jgi:hypothetical protein
MAEINTVADFHAQIDVMNYMIAGLGLLVSAFSVMVWYFMKSERENIKEAIAALGSTIDRLDKQYEIQSKMIKIIARQTKVEIGE